MSYIGQQPADRVLTSADISDAAITAAKLASSSVTQPKVDSGVAGTGPTFSAYQNSAQTTASYTPTKILFQVEEWDTNNNFASSTFTPTVAGYYQVNSQVCFTTAAATRYAYIGIAKNGTMLRVGSDNKLDSNDYSNVVVSAVIYCNGTTDYIEIYAGHNHSSSVATISFSNQYTWFNACLMRAA